MGSLLGVAPERLARLLPVAFARDDCGCALAPTIRGLATHTPQRPRHTASGRFIVDDGASAGSAASLVAASADASLRDQKKNGSMA